MSKNTDCRAAEKFISQLGSTNTKPKKLGYLALFLLVMFAAPLRAQTAARIIGTVHDQNGHPIAAAAVDAVGQKSSLRRKLATDDNGSFTLSELVPDTYLISAGCNICSDASSIVEIGAGQARSIQIELNTDSSSTVVSLDTRATTLDTSSARLGMNVTDTEIDSLPVNGRTFAALALTAPLITNSGSAEFSALRFAGRSSQQNHYTLDGVDDSSVVKAEPSFVPGSGYEFRLRNSLGTVAEFRVDSAAYSAEDGDGSGGQIKLVSKAGSGNWHGSLFEFFRNDKVDATNFFDRDGKTELRLNHFGGNVSGPVRKDRLFVFANLTELKQCAGFNIFEAVPSILLRSTASAAISPVLQAIPFGFSSTADPDVNLSERQAVARQNEFNFSTRVDYLASIKQRFFIRYSRSSGTLLGPDLSVTPRMLSTASKPDQIVANWTYQLSPTIIYQVTGGINRSPIRLSTSSGSADLTGSRILVGNPIADRFASPGDQILLENGNYGSTADYHGRTYNLLNSFDWTKGAHSIQAGAEIQAVRVPLAIIGGLTYQFRDDTSFLSNKDADVVYAPNLPARKMEAENYSGYIQDNWRLNERIQLVFGLRYEYFSAPREQSNRAVVFDYVTLNGQPSKGAFYSASKLGFQPRLAFTWSPQALKNNTVLRIGAGVYDSRNAFFDTIAPLQNAMPALFLAGAAFPVTASRLLLSHDTIAKPQAFDAGTFGMHGRNYLLSASLQQVLPHQFVAEAGYAGILSRHLTEEGAANLAYAIDPDSGATLRRSSAYSAIPYLMNGGNSSYHALRLGLNRHLVDNLTVTASYSLSHSIGNTAGAGETGFAQNPFCLACERSDNDFDIRHTFSANAVYQLPLGKGHPHLQSGIWSSLLGSWSIAGAWNVRSGLPVNVIMDRSDEIYYSPTSRLYYSRSAELPRDAVALENAPGGLEGLAAFRPDSVPGVNPYLKNSTQWLNPAAFAIPAPGTLGNLGRNALRGPGFQQVDLQLSRSFALSEKLQLEMRVEAFNLLNHPNFSNPIVLLPDSTHDVQPGQAYNRALAPDFGSINSTVGRTVGLGTSRQFQISARVQF